MMGVNHVLKTCHAYHQSSCSCKKMEQSEMAKGNMEPSNYQHLFHMKRGGMVASQTIKHVNDLNTSVQHPSAEISTFFFPAPRPTITCGICRGCGSFVSWRFKNMSESKTDPPGTLAHINSSCKGKELSNYFDLASMQIQGSFTPTYLSMHNYRHKSVSSWATGAILPRMSGVKVVS